MCGRYTLRHPGGHRWLQGLGGELAVPRYNIAPSQQVPVLGRDASGERVLRPAVWGFRPRWLDAGRRAPINARAESAADKPMFRAAFHRGRCLVPADGWYEWQARDRGPKQPYFFHRPDDAVFFFAGLATRDPQGHTTMALLTTAANAPSAAIHERMPVMLPDDTAATAWLDPDAADDTLRGLLRPAPDDLTRVRPIRRAVNRVDNDGPSLIRPLDDGAAEQGQ